MNIGGSACLDFRTCSKIWNLSGFLNISVLLCLTLAVHVTSVMQATPQRVELVRAYRWCGHDTGRFQLIEAEGYRIEGVTEIVSEKAETVWRRALTPAEAAEEAARYQIYP